MTPAAYLIMWTAFSCPWGLGWLPAPAKALACSSKREIRQVATKREAEKIALETPEESTSVYHLERGKYVSKEIYWRVIIEP